MTIIVAVLLVFAALMFIGAFLRPNIEDRSDEEY